MHYAHKNTHINVNVGVNMKQPFLNCKLFTTNTREAKITNLVIS